MPAIRISIHQYQLADFPDYLDLISGREEMRYIFYKEITLDFARAKFDSFFPTYLEHPGLGHFKVCNEMGELIGTCKLEPYRKDETLLELGYILKKSYWRQGIGTLICEELLALGLELRPDMDIIAVIDPENIASRKLLEKFGFQTYFLGVEDDILSEKLIRKAALIS